MTGSKNKDTQDDKLNTKIERKRRLNRKEQKARKKLKKKTRFPREICQEGNDINEGTNRSQRQESITSSREKVAGLNKLDVAECDEYMSNYKPVTIPSLIESSNEIKSSSLGKWFPKAKVIKSRISYTNADIKKTSAKSSLVLFYQYAKDPWSDSKVRQLVSYLTEIAGVRTIAGRIRVASEGVNATLSSVDHENISAKMTLRHVCRDLQNFDPKVFACTDFKFLDDLSPDRHFKDFKILPVQELVYYGWSPKEAPLKAGGVHLPAREFHKMLEQDETVVIDVRNHYEAAIGRFDGQQKETTSSERGGAEYIDPKLRKSTDFASWLEKPETEQKLKNKKVLMYCTGGVRCERASAYLNSKMGDNVQGVYQLQGGIERYLQEFSSDGGGHWRGKNFVFDKREATSVTNKNGDGGVIQKSNSDKPESQLETRCCLCQKMWDRYIGKKKCTMCGVPVLMCDSCMSSNKKNKPVLRCPLCVEQDITVPADNVEYTENGVSGKCEEIEPGQQNVAPSVLKWGGGHARRKKDLKRELLRRKNLKRRPCQHGTSCTREDCFFYHPGRD
eukprot:CAMPEP_0178897452 /NCGR_PEP_ID=MMETSP0786-20121207/1756_1 /TAXON_ID=186022 /ORGANISM="Thalassionema frauenfeldii, Strain CCMP 1798" /LENGTH=560 /DNA_ID=CAMNT_0020568007 /DNA_START=33 /DNA_END=1715 /DNA_ORIENTATION=+